MNPLNDLPASTSKQFSLNKLDGLKILRFLLVQLIGLLVTLAPTLAGYTYRFHGKDYTTEVLLVGSTLVEAARRWLAGRPK